MVTGNATPDRRAQFSSAAFDVVASGGLRALTHRAVDDAAGVPPGSVNYYAPNRSKLQQLALQEAFERMREIAVREFEPIFDTMAGGHRPSETMILDCAVGFIEAMTTEGRGLVVVRHALLIEAQFDPALRELIVANRSRFVGFADQITLEFWPTRPERAAELIVAVIEGLLQQETLVTAQPFDAAMNRATVARILGFSAES